jgi:hypothetical protein
MKKIITTLIILIFSVSFTYSQVETQLTLEEKIEQSRILWIENRKIAEEYAVEHGLPIRQVSKDGEVIEIQAISENGIPLYYITHNADAARTVGANRVYSGGGAGLSLSGDGITLGIWDGGGVRTSHQEFTSSRATQRDTPSGTSWHATHVAGTMIGAGVDSDAKGMSYAADLDCYEWNNDVSEMRSAAGSGLKVSNHSYGFVTGWYYNSSNSTWYWYGDVSVSTTEDAYFGFYSYQTSLYDDIAYDYPNYLICSSAGNDRDDGPSAGTGHYYRSGSWVWSTATREKDGGTDGYDCLPSSSVAKNILVVGAVYDITSGYNDPSDVVMTDFSSWGPTDDGRIKPDIVANGYGLYSAYSSSNSSYVPASGTSMACPNTSGALGLLLEHHKDLHGSTATMRSATLKGIVIHTAHEAGSNDGPDYKFGWGLLNIEGAAELMTTNADRSEDYDIQELTLSSSETEEITGYSDGNSPIRVTICWTDPAASYSSLSLNNRTSKLVNDLDLRITRSSNTYYPYKLSYSNPGNAATTGDNDVDNVEQVYIESPSEGTYTISINHEGSLSGGSQNFSVIISGLEPVSEPVISSQPDDSQVCPGASTFFSAEVSGEVDDYLWYFSDDDGSSWYEASDTDHYTDHTTSTLTVDDVSGDMNGYLYRLMADNFYGTAYTDPAELSVYQSATISSHPMSQDITAGEDTFFSVTDDGGESYRWQVSVDDGDTWSYISNGGVYSNATTSTLNLNDVPLSYSGYMYRVEVSNICGFETYSNTADINVSGYVQMTAHPDDITVCIGDDDVFYCTISGVPDPTLHWQVSTDDGETWNDISDDTYYSGYNSSSLTVSSIIAIMNGNLYRLKAQNDYETVYSNTAELIIYPNATISSHPMSQDITAGEDTFFSVTDDGGESYRWQVSVDDGDTWSYISNGGVYSNATTSTLNLNDVPLSYSGYMYRAEVSNICEFETYSNTADINVSGYVQMTAHPDDITVCIGDNDVFYCTISGVPDPTLQWQVSTDDGETWNDISDDTYYSGYNSSSLTVSSIIAIMNGNLYRLKAQNDYETVYSNTAELIIYLNATISSHPMSQDITAGEDTFFSVTDDGGESYRWQVSVDDGDTWSYISNGGVYSNATTSTLNLNDVPLSYSGYMYRAEVSNICEFETYSNTADINVSGYIEVFYNPDDYTTCIGEDAYLYAVILGEPDPSLQWQVSINDGGNWSNISNGSQYAGVTTNTLTIYSPTEGMQDYLYRLSGTNSIGNIQTSSASFILEDELVVISQPSNASVSAGDDHTFTADIGDPDELNWQISTDNGDTWDWLDNDWPYSGVYTQYLYIEYITANMDGYQYRLVGYNTCPDGATTNAAELTVETSLSITSNPNDTEACRDGQAFFRCNVESNPDPELQWQVSTDNGSSWTGLSDNDVYDGTSTEILEIISVQSYMEGFLYRLYATNSFDEAVSESAILNITPIPLITEDLSNQNACENGEAVLEFQVDGDDLSYTWYYSTNNGTSWVEIFNDDIFSGANTNALTINSVSIEMDDHIFFCLIENICEDMETTDFVGLNILENVDITEPDDQEVCNGGTVDFSASVSDADNLEYLWQRSIDNGSNWSSLSNNDVFSGVSTLTLTIEEVSNQFDGDLFRLRVINDCGTSYSQPTQLSVTNPILVDAGDDIDLCYGEEVDIEISVSGGASPYQYYWTPSTGLSSSSIANPTAQPTETTTYTVYVTDSEGCQGSDQITINVNPELFANAGSNEIICHGSNIQLNGSADGGSGVYGYSWSPSTGLSNSNIQNPIASPAETTTYTLTITDSEGCIATDQVTIEVNPELFANAGGDEFICYGSEVQLNGSADGGSEVYEYSWTPADGLDDPHSPDPVANPTLTTEYTLTVTDSEGCVDSDVMTVEVNPELFANAGDDEFICYGGEVQLQGSISGGDNDLEYSWSPSTGLNDPNILNPVADPSETTTYTLTVIDGQGCSKTDEVIVEVNPELIASAGSDKNLCYGGEVQLDGSAIGGNNEYQYSWSPSSGLSSTNIATPIASPLETLTYTLTVTDGEGCVSVDEVQVEVNNAVFVDAGNDLLVCNGSEEQFDIIIEGGTPPYNYYWTPSDGLSDQFVRNPVVSPEQATTTYTVYVTDSQNCTGSDEIVVSLNPELFVDAGDDEFFCYGSEVQLNGSADGGSEIYQYSWTPVDGLDDPNIPDPIANPTVTTEYTLTVTDSEGCVVSDVMIVEVNPELFANAGDDEFICYGSEVQLNGSADGGSEIYQYSWTPVDGLDDSNSPDPIANPTSTTEYTLTVTDSEGCVDSDVMTVEVNPELFANAGDDEFICYGGEVQLQGSISGGDNDLEYSWSPSTGLNDPNILNPVADPSETTTYTLTVIDGQGCSKTDEVIVEVNPELIASAGSDKNLCYGGEVQLDGSAIGGNNEYQYSWSPSTGLSSTNIATPIASPLETITYTLTVTDGEGCVSLDQVQIDVNNAVFVDIGSDFVVCYGSEEQFDIIVEGGTPPYNYYWTPSDGLSDQFVKNPVVSPEQTATTYTVYVTDSQNCTGSDEIVVSLNPELFVNAGDDEFICYGSEVQLNGSADGGSEIYQYSWTPVDGLDDPNSPDPVANPTLTTEYTLTITDSEGCVVSDKMTVEVNPELFVNAGDDEFICYGSEVQLNGSADGGSEIYQYSWTPVDGLDDPNSPDPIANPTVTTEYTLTITDSEGCVVSDRMTVEVNPELFVNAGDDEFICYGSEVQLNGSADGGSEIYQYSWTPADGLDDPNSPNPVANPTATTEYTLTITDSEGCVVSDVMTVEVNPELFVNAGDDEFICYGSEVQLNGSADGGSEIYQYSWTPVDGLDDPNSPDPIANPTVTTEYTLTITDSEGCVVSDRMTVEVNPELFVNAGDDEFICYGSEVQLNGSADGGSEIYQYSWTPVDGLDDPNSPNPVANPTATTEYTLTITDSEGCVVSDRMTVEVNPELFVNAGDDEFICYGSEVQLNGSADGGSEIYQYSWTPVDGLDDPNSPDPIANPTVTTEYTLTITDSEGCVVSDVMTVEVNPELFVNAGDDEFICYGSEVQLNGSADGGSEIYQYSWTPVDGIDDPNSPDPVANPTVTTEYTLTITDSEGCVVSDRMTVEVNPELFVNAGDDEFICYGSEVQLNGSADGGSEIYQYSWTPVDGLDDPNSPDPVANPTVTNRIYIDYYRF